MWACSATFPEARREAIGEIRQIIKGDFDLGKVERIPLGFKIKDVELQSKLQNLLYKFVSSEARETLVSDLVSLGYRVGLLMPDPKTHEFLNEEHASIDNLSQKHGIKREDVFGISDYVSGRSITNYPREIFNQSLDRVLINWAYQRFDLRSLHQRILSSNLEFEFSPLGNGNRVLMGDDFAFVCEPEPLAQDYYAAVKKDLEKRGIRLFSIPHGWADMFSRATLEPFTTEKRIFAPTHHPDMSVMFLPREKALFFSKMYYWQNKERIDRVIDQISPNIFDVLPDEDGVPINSLPLPDGGVFMDRAASRSQEIIRSHGIRVETTSKPFGIAAWGGFAGIHCATNTLLMPEGETA